MKKIITNADIAAIFLDNEGVITYMTPSMNQIAGVVKEDIGRTYKECTFIQFNQNLYDYIEMFTKNMSHQESLQESFYHPTNNLIELELLDCNNLNYLVRIHPYQLMNNMIVGVILTFFNISTRIQMEKELELRREKYRILVELADCAIWEYNINTKSLKHSRKSNGKNTSIDMEIPDYRNYMINRNLIYHEDIDVFNQYCDSMDQGKDNIHYEIRTLGEHYEYIWMRYEGTAIRNSSGIAHIIIGKTTNIDEEKKEKEKLVQKTLLDPLTGLYNQSAAREKIETYLEYCNHEKTNDIHGLMIIDIDNFKQINDQWGHLYGDTVLEVFTSDLSKLFASTDIVGRIGGDEFIVFFKSLKNTEHLGSAAKAVLSMTKDKLTELKSGGISVSIGTAIFPDHGKTYAKLFMNADIALYKAKQNGKNNYVMYQSELSNSVHQGETIRKINPVKTNTIDTLTSVDKKLINFAFDIVNEAAEIGTAIEQIFSEIGKYYDLSRISVFEVKTNLAESKVTYEWKINGMKASNECPIIKTKDTIDEYISLFHESGLYYCNNTSFANAIPERKAFYEFMGTKAVVQCAIYDSNVFIGSVNYEDCKKDRIWNKSELDTLYTLTKLISNFIIQLRNKQELKDEIFFTQAMLDNQKLNNFAIKPGTYELMFLSSYTEQAFPHIKVGDLCYKAIFGKNVPCDTCPLKSLSETNRRVSSESYNEDTDSWYSTTATLVDLPNGEQINLVCSSDVTGFVDRVKAKDPLTGLLTFSKFEVEAMKMIAKTPSEKLVIFYTDFDRFKNINDEWGYAVGDQVLTFYSSEVSKYLVKDELCCRISEDKFLLLLKYENRDDILKRVKCIGNSFFKNIKTKFPTLNPILTCGIYFFTSSDALISEAIDKANMARKTVKGSLTSRWVIYDEVLHTRMEKEKMIEQRMYKALSNHEFEVFLQPKVDLNNLAIIGAEALVRWRMSDETLLPPIEFIPIFERNGFIKELDFYVYDIVFRKIKEWLSLGQDPFIISVNLSRVHITDSFFIEKLDRLVEKYRIPPNLIELEITESIFLNDLELTVKVLNELHHRGFLLSIDDFGFGYSSLNILKNLPVDIIKLDKEFFMQNKMEQKDEIIISGIISLVKGLGMEVISEGVETEDQVRFLQEHSCDMAQGYYFYRPIPMKDFEQLIRSRSK
jgi:diguanylate cyclase (GGDEF)-like protein